MSRGKLSKNKEMPEEKKLPKKELLSAQDVLKMMEGEFKTKTASLLSDEDAGLVKYWLDMNIYSLNYIISGDLKKGFPIGRTVEYYGDNSTGKTLIALYCAADAIRKNVIVNYYDPECAMDREFAKKLGADPTQIIYDEKVDTVEQLEQKIEKTIKIKEVGKIKQPFLLILDSLAMLSTIHEMETPEKSDMSKAKKLKQITRRLTRKMASNDIGFLVLNHTIANISPMPFAPKKTTTGGSAIPFLASVRLETKIFKKLKDTKTNEVTGVKIKVICTKNKLTRPFRECLIDFDYRTLSMDKYSGLGEMLEKREIIDKCKIGASNGWRYKDKEFKQKELGQAIEENKWLDEFNELLKKYDQKNTDVESVNADTISVEEDAEIEGNLEDINEIDTE